MKTTSLMSLTEVDLYDHFCRIRHLSPMRSMMASPFAIFRKHQKELMVIFTGMAIFCWIVLDSVDGRRGPMSPAAVVLFVAMMGAGIGYIWTVRDKEKSSNAWLNGAVLGAVLGLILVMANQQKEIGISTSVGTVTREQLLALRGQREAANRFVARAFYQREHAEQMAQFLLPRYTFGGMDTREIVAAYLLEREADHFGITVTNDYINKFIDEVSDNKLSDREFEGTCRELGFTQKQLFELLRKELRVRITMQLLNPETLYLPEQYWSDFQKFNVRHSIDASAIPVESFAAAVDTPTEGDLKKLFDEFKSVFPAGSNPGFRVPEKKRLAYFTASFEDFEKQVGEISEADLKTLYEETKETFYKVESLPDQASDKSPLGELKLPAPSKKAEADESKDEPAKTEPSKTEGDKPATPEDKKPEEKKPADEKKPAEPATKEPASQDGAKSESQDGEEDDSDSPSDEQDQPTPAKAEVPAAEKSADKPAVEKPAAAKGDEKAPAKAVQPTTKDGVETPAANVDEKKDEKDDSKPADKQPAGDKPTVEKTDSEKPTVEVKYKPFEDVRDELRDKLLRQRAQAALQAKLVAAKDYVSNEYFKIGEEIATSEDKKLLGTEAERVKLTEAERAKREAERAKLQAEQIAKRLSEHVAKFAKDNGLSFVETTLLSYDELANSKDYQLAAANEPFDFSSGRFVQPRNVPTVIFGGGLTPFIPEKADSTDHHFIYWITEVAAERVPEFGDEGIRATVEKAWRMQKARTKAEQRADELAKIAREATGKPLSEAFTTTTVTGEKEAVELTVISTPPFSWLRQSIQGMQMNPWSQPQIEFGFVPGIDKIDNDFMKAVADMSIGDVKVLPNNDKTSYYVVHLKDRTPSGKADDPGMTALHQQFLSEDVSRSPIYGGLARSQAQMIFARWLGEFMKKYSVDLAAVDAL